MMGSSSMAVNVRGLGLITPKQSSSSSNPMHACSLKTTLPKAGTGKLLLQRKRIDRDYSFFIDKKVILLQWRRFEGLQVSAVCTGRSRRLSGSHGTKMNLIVRLVRVVRSYVNALLSSVEDPEKILDQAVLEMNDDLTKMRQASAQVLASQKMLDNKYQAAQKSADDWYRRAQLALSKGDEDLAREALKRRKSHVDTATSLKSQLDQQKSVVENLVNNTRLLENKIQEAKSKKDTLKARAQSAKTATEVNEMLGNINTSKALSAFENIEEKVMALESQAEALNQLSTDELEAKFSLLEDASVDDDLAKLKRELSGRSTRGELPAGRSAGSSSSSSAFPFRETEIERELHELRRKAKQL